MLRVLDDQITLHLPSRSSNGRILPLLLINSRSGVLVPPQMHRRNGVVLPLRSINSLRRTLLLPFMHRHNGVRLPLPSAYRSREKKPGAPRR